MAHVKFVIQALPRSGAGLVMSALAKHPQCRAQGCVFYGNTVETEAAMLAAGSWRALFNSVTSPLLQQTGNTASGFISYRYPSAMQSGLGVKWEWSQTLWQYLTDKGHTEAQIVRIWRDDPIARAISASIALRTNVLATRKNSDAARVYFIDINHPADIQPWVLRHFLDEWIAAEQLPTGKTPPLTITYEDLIGNWRGGMQAIQQRLGLDVMELTSPLAKMGDIPPHRLVANWDLLVKSFRSTRYEQYFERYNSYFLPVYMRQLGAA